MITLNYEPRALAKGAAKSSVSPEVIRKGGKMPAIFYGPKEKATSIIIAQSEFIKVWKKAGESSVIILKAAGSTSAADEHEALIHAIDVHPVTGAPRHADFYVIEKGAKVKVDVQLVFDGVSPAVKDLGAILVKVLREVEIEAGAKDLPHEIHVDISSLVDLKSVIHASDLKLPTGVTLITKQDEIVASIAEAKEEVEEAPTAVDMSAIEVEKKGKEAKEGEEGAEPAADGKAAPKAEKADKK